MRLATLQLGIRSLLLHKLRSFLTMLGTILGVGSVISMLAIGEGSKTEAVEQIKKLGAANIIIKSVKPTVKDTPTDESSTQTRARVLEYGLLYKDLEVLKATIPTIKHAVPIALVRRNAQNSRLRVKNARILGTTPEYLDIKSLKVRRGRFITDVDIQKTGNVAVLGAGAATKLFGYEDPINKPLLLGSTAVIVIGVLDTQASGKATAGAVERDDFNNDIYIPITAAQRRFGELTLVASTGSMSLEKTQLSEITLSVTDENLVSQTAAMAKKLLKASHPKNDDFEVQVPLELLQQAEREKRVWNLVLGSIAGISLLVGGVGIMNIMLATVTERTREIGIRRAIGAKRRDITIQFLIETVVLSTTGGLLGVIVGVAIAQAVSMGSDIQTIISWWPILMAFGISVAIGIIFGIYPARRAALMDPIEALRTE